MIYETSFGRTNIFIIKEENGELSFNPFIIKSMSENEVILRFIKPTQTKRNNKGM
ncbi:MAG: hypothetical protein IPO92_11650 [Saprospiraceae bacterium]|nr:hypothetical protein [Saprospiraceae bacterium]